MLLPAVLICVATRADQEALAKRNATRPRTGSSDGPEASAQVMQTVLSSKVLQRVVFAVIEKVLRTWPKARGGFADCQRYREALQQVLEDVQRHARENQREDRRMHLLIEFVVADQDALVDFIGRSWPRGRRALIFRPANYCSSREYPPRYAGRNLLAIARDSFGLDREDAEELIALEIDP